MLVFQICTTPPFAQMACVSSWLVLIVAFVTVAVPPALDLMPSALAPLTSIRVPSILTMPPLPSSKADEYWPLVRHHLSCFLENQEEVDEITAEVFVVAWRKLRPDRPMGLRWFVRTADNKLRDVDRSARSRGRALDALSRGLQNATETIHPLDALALRQAMKILNARERQVVVLTYWDDLNAGEVAEVLHCSPAAVWTTLTRARTKLRTQLEPKESEQ